MPAHYWWIWMIIAAAFIVGEILTTGFFLLCFGIGAALSGLLALFGLGMAWQLVAFILASSVLFGVSRKFADRVSKEQPPGIGADRFTGHECVVLEEIDNAKNTGRIRLGREEWRAESETGEIIPADTTVRVTRVEGTHLMVIRIGEGD